MFDRGHGRKTDPGDARTVAVVAIRTAGLTQVQTDGELVALRLLAERRRELVRTRTQTVNRLHQLLTELIPAGAEKNLTASKAKTLLGKVRPRDVAGRTRRALAVDLVDDVSGLDRKLKTLDKQHAEAVAATGTSLPRATPRRPRLPSPHRRPHPAPAGRSALNVSGGPGRTLGGDYKVQRG